MAIVLYRTRREIKEKRIKNFRITTSLYGFCLLVSGIFGELFLSSEKAIVITAPMIAILGVFLLVMGLCRENDSKIQAWKIYPIIFVAVTIISLLDYSLTLQNFLSGLKFSALVFIVHIFCLFAIWCREKYGNMHRYH